MIIWHNVDGFGYVGYGVEMYKSVHKIRFMKNGENIKIIRYIYILLYIPAI